MTPDFEERILRNPALGAMLLWQFSDSFAKYSETDEAPTLPAIAIASAMLLHRPTVSRIKGMLLVGGNGLARAIDAEPDVIADLQLRVEAHLRFALDSLGMATASQLLTTVEGVDSLDMFYPGRDNLPPILLRAAEKISPQMAAARRLGAWFSGVTLVTMCAQLRLRI